MGLWGGLKSIGRGIGKGVKKAGKWVGNEVVRTLDPIRKGIKGDWKGALAGIGHNIKRAAQVAAVAGSGGIAGVGLGTLGAIGGGARSVAIAECRRARLSATSDAASLLKSVSAEWSMLYLAA